jgi:hypothetical protein
LLFYGDDHLVEYDFVVAPGASASDIAMKFEGAGAPTLDEAGNLVLPVVGGAAVHKAAYICQEENGIRSAADGTYVLLEDGAIGFEIYAYDQNRPLIIDPEISYSTYLGGGGTDEGLGIAVDGFGQAHVAGQASGGFPIKNAFQATFGGFPRDAFITKLNASGTDLVYSTYLGFNAQDKGAAIALDAAGNVLVTGFAESTNFPTASPASATNSGNRDVFAAKLGAAWNTLVFSTYGGGGANDLGEAIAVDGAGNVFVVGYTGSTDFPTKNALQTEKATGGDDAFVTRLGSDGSVAFSTYLGGEGVDRGWGVAVDQAGRPFLVGQTSSSDFPTAASSIGPQCTFSAPPSCSTDVFLTLLMKDGSALVSSDYFGGSSTDYGKGVAFGGSGAIYIVGTTGSTDFPTRSAFQPGRAALFDSFVTKFGSSLEIFVADEEPPRDR